MAKTADRYFLADPWKIIEEGFNPSYGMVSESVFSIGNEYMGVRGYFDEGYSGESLVGSYFNGIYERLEHAPSPYKGIVNSTEFMVNSVNWIFTRIYAEEEQLDLKKSNFSCFKRVLDLRSGVLSRSFTWTTRSGKMLRLEFERFVSMNRVHVGAQKISITPLNFSGEVKIIAGLDFSGIHVAYGRNFWNCSDMRTDENYLGIAGTVENTGFKVFSNCVFHGDIRSQKDIFANEKSVAKEFIVRLDKGVKAEITRIAANLADRGASGESADTFKDLCGHSRNEIAGLDYEMLREENEAWWQAAWNKSDIVIKGDDLNQQGIRFCIFQMFQTYHGAMKGANIGAKGLTGEAYNGNAFWDTEIYCLPFFIFNNLEAAKNLLVFRYQTLPEAKKRAESLDCKGAFYPIATISGRECCTLWQHASLQLQASTAVAYSIWFYVRMSGDREFLTECGIPMLVEICRMLATRGSWTENGTKYGYYCVMGPDEFQMMVNNNCYTNYMGKFAFNYTLDVLRELKNQDERQYAALAGKMELSDDECAMWGKMAECMYIPYDSETKLYEQHDGYFKLPHVDVSAIPVEDFPLYHHWSYDRIYRNDMLKQPDVLMFMLLFNKSFPEEVIRKNYEFYEPRCIHESSLSPSVHSILATQLKKFEEAYEFFKFATRMDLDNYNRNTAEGLHITSIAAAWMNIVYGFGGLRTDGDILSFSPSIPREWEGYSFRLNYRNCTIIVDVGKETVALRAEGGEEITVEVYGKEIRLGNEAVILEIPDEWRWSD